MAPAFKDISGQLRSLEDAQEASGVVQKYLLAGDGVVPPDLSVCLPTILEILKVYIALLGEAGRRKGEQDAEGISPQAE